jgi:outer membrane receptor for ferrienterochelin and colicins
MFERNKNPGVTIPVIVFAILFLHWYSFSMEEKQEEKKIEDVEELSLEKLLNIKVTVASRMEETASDSPSSVTVFTQADIRNMGISHLGELLNFVPGFQTTRDIEQGTADRFSSRGRGSALSESVLILIDGLRINDLYTGGVSILNRLIAVENIKQVEIIRGPGSALYGSNAFMGVVNIVTLNNENNASINAGNLKSKEIAINLSKTFSKGIQVSAFASTFSDEGYPYKGITDAFGRTGDTSDPTQGIDAYLTLKYKNFTLRGRHMERTLRNFLTFGGLANHTNKESTKQTSISTEYVTNSTSKLRMHFGFDYLEDQWDVISLLIPKDTEIAPGFTLSENFTGGPFLESYYFLLKADFMYGFSDAHQLTGGITFMKTGISKVLNLMTHHPVFLDYYGDIVEFSGAYSFNKENTRNIWGFYLQEHFRLGKRIKTTIGLRLDRYSDFGSSLNPRFALVYSSSFKGIFKLMYGTAFRAPNFLELYDKNNPVDFGNPDLNPEKAETMEVAYIQMFKRFQLGVTYFHNRIKDLIVPGEPVTHPDNPLEAPRFKNEGKTITEGLELEIRFQPFTNFVISGTYTHLFDADQLPVSPDFGSLILNYKLNRFNLNINGIYRRSMKLLPSQESYVLLNTAVHFTLVPDLELQAAAFNLFDKQYTTFSHVLPDGVYNRGRTFKVGLLFQW